MRRDVDVGDDLLGEHATERGRSLHHLRFPNRREAASNRFTGLVDAQRVRVVAVEAAHGLLAAHARRSSSRVLMLRKASASSSKPTSTTFSAAYQASILRPPLARNASRLSRTCRFMSANTGCGWSPVLATAN